MEETKDLLSRAVIKIKSKVLPQTDEKIFTADHQHCQIYNILGVFDTPDLDTEEQVKYIYDFLMNNGGNPKDQILSIQTKIGIPRGLDNDVGRIYKYCRLQEKARKDLERYEYTKRQINAFGSDRRE